MQDDHFQPPPVPLCSKALVAVLKARIYEAIVHGKASDAKLFLDIIDRLARLNWLDEMEPAARAAQNLAEDAQDRADLHAKLYAFVVAETGN